MHFLCYYTEKTGWFLSGKIASDDILSAFFKYYNEMLCGG